MTTVQCPSCGSAAPETAEWCSLCFARLREPAVPAVPAAAVSVPEATGGGAAGVEQAVDPLTDPLPVVLAATTGVPAAGAATTTAPGVSAAPAAAPGTAAVDPLAAKATWPCPGCGSAVALSQDECPDCGASFLGGISTQPVLRLPGVGDVSQLSQGQRLVVGLVIASALIVILVLLATIAGHIV